MSESLQSEMSVRFFIFSIIISSILILSSFLTAPGMFDFVNFGYQKFVPQLQERKSNINIQILDLKKEARNLITEGNSYRIKLRLESDKYYIQWNSRAIVALPPAEFFGDTPESQANNRISNQEKRSEINEKLTKLEANMRNLYADLEDIDKSIDKYSTESNTAYLVMRAISLGALGALVTNLGRGSSALNLDQKLQRYSVKDLTTSLIIGSIISVVAIALFHTRQITIFKLTDSEQNIPDYWRTTILCLLAGAFADRLFNAASDKVNLFVGDRPKNIDSKTVSPASGGSQAGQPNHTLASSSAGTPLS